MKNDPVLLPPDLRDHPLRPLPTKLAAAYLGINRSKLKRLAKDGKIPYARPHYRFMFLLTDLDNFLLTCRRPLTAQTWTWTRYSEEMPVEAISKLVNLPIREVNYALTKGTLKDRTYASVRCFLFAKLEKYMIEAFKWQPNP